MKKAITILSILACSLNLTALAQQPDASFRLVRHEWTLRQDGTSDYRYRHEVQILRNRALTAYADKGETFVVYNPDIEEVTVNEAYTVQLDGTRVDMPQNAFIHQLPSECADCGRFNHLRELAMVHTGMEIGCVVVVDYTVHRRYNLLYETLPLLLDSPVERLEIQVNAPAGMEVRQALLGEPYLPKGVTKADVLKNSIVLNNLPQVPREPYMPEHIVPSLHLYNSLPDHTPAFRTERFRGAEVAMGQTMTAHAKENIVAARDFIIDNIHLNDIHPRHLGYRHATPDEVWQSGCGTATDKAVLLAAILNNENYPARVIGDNMDEVGVTIDTIEYRLDVRRRTPPEPIGIARDEVLTYRLNADEEARIDTLEGGFYRLNLNQIPTALPRAAALPLQRTTPLQTSACTIEDNRTLTLPKGIVMVGEGISQNLDYPGLGSLEISIKQSGKKLKIARRMTLEKSLIPVGDYARFRQLIATWQQVDHLVFRNK
ncbi:MAG: DUF3857 domain-containing protein [Bacteroidales bacterium]|nr:DUF3857 domain-containing protein [Bacteroidales bacterium]